MYTQGIITRQAHVDAFLFHGKKSLVEGASFWRALLPGWQARFNPHIFAKKKLDQQAAARK